MEEIENVPDNQQSNKSSVNIPIKPPKRIIYFRDGTTEEYSDDEDEHDCEQKICEQDLVPDKQLTWVPWLSRKAVKSGRNVLYACDYLGESLAWFFGITTPKYYFEIEEAKRLEAERIKDENEKKGWEVKEYGDSVFSNQPQVEKEVTNV